jgi:hypothetical protein
MTSYDVRTSDNDSSYGTFGTREAAEHALSIISRGLDPNAHIVVTKDWRDRALAAEATIARVREVCEDKYIGPPTEYGEGFQNGYNDALSQVLRALDDAEQSEHWDGTTPLEGGDS